MRAIDTKAWLWLLGPCACSLVACVSAREADQQGKSSFVSGAPSASLDYQMAVAGAGAAGATGTASTGGAGGVVGMPTAGMIADPMAGVGGAGGAAGEAMLAGAGGAGGLPSGGAGGAGSGGAGGASGVEPTGGVGAAGGGGSSAGTLTIDFTSVGNDGEYAPRNIGAVWIETSSGMFVKTIERWAGVRAGHLTRWNQASGGWGGGFFFASGGGSADEMDAITSATLRTHQEHRLTWDMQDPSGALVADGMYRIVIEVTESERVASVTAEIDFEKGAAPVSLSPTDEGPYSGLSVTYTP